MFLSGNVYNGFRKFWQYCQNWNLQTLALFSYSSFITFFPQNIEEKVGQKSHGPYFYAYWKQDKKLNKRYVGKNLEDFRLRKIAKDMKTTHSK